MQNKYETIGFEPKCTETNKFSSHDSAMVYAAASQALSLKRIADYLEIIVKSGG